jgi:hypothetical protein
MPLAKTRAAADRPRTMVRLIVINLTFSQVELVSPWILAVLPLVLEVPERPEKRRFLAGRPVLGET